MISKLIAALGSTVVPAAFKDFMLLYNIRLEKQIEQLAEAKMSRELNDSRFL